MKKIIILTAILIAMSTTSFAKGEPCQGNWQCSWNEFCYKPDWQKGICVPKS